MVKLLKNDCFYCQKGNIMAGVCFLAGRWSLPIHTIPYQTQASGLPTFILGPSCKKKVEFVKRNAVMSIMQILLTKMKLNITIKQDLSSSDHHR